MRMFGKYLASGDIEPLITYPDNLVERNMGIQYYKTAMVLSLLRSSILGEEMFDDAFKQYIERWAYKHPTPYDFFRTIEDVSGEDLSWFWRSWIYNSWSLDQSVIDVSYPSGSAENGAVITIANMREVPMPVVVEITTESGAVSRKKLPWKYGRRVLNGPLELTITRKLKKWFWIRTLNTQTLMERIISGRQKSRATRLRNILSSAEKKGCKKAQPICLLSL